MLAECGGDLWIDRGGRRIIQINRQRQRAVAGWVGGWSRHV
jgi:hypothetical protein